MTKKKIQFSKIYFYIIICFNLIILSFISFININIDPEKIYPEKIKIYKNDFKLEENIKKLISSKGKMVYQEKYWNEREFYNIFSKNAHTAECIIFGSSAIVTISANQTPQVLKKSCKTTLNLGLSGGTIEDYLAFSNNIDPKKIRNKKIIMTIHPFTLNFNRDHRWIVNSKNFDVFLEKLRLNKSHKDNNDLKNENLSKLLKNVTNLEYLKTSIKILLHSNKKKFRIQDKVTEDEIKKNNVIMFDGSRKKMLDIPKNRDIDLSPSLINYKILKDRWYDESILKLIINYKKYYEPQNEIVFLLTPYHPEVWKLKNEPIVEAMIIVEKKINEFAKNNNINVIGSYNPSNLNCNKHEFYDAIHASNKCLKKLETFSFFNK